MESPSSKVEVMKQAIKEVMEEVRGGTNSSTDDGEDDKHRRLLSKLMSQLEKLEAESEVDREESVDDEKTKTNIKKLRLEEDEEAKIAKELKKLKRQNFITQCLVSVMIVLTVAWQVSEVSIILKLKDGLNHPFRSIGSLFTRMLTPPKTNGDEEETDSSITNHLIESTGIGDLKIPELPHVEMPKNRLGF